MALTATKRIRSYFVQDENGDLKHIDMRASLHDDGFKVQHTSKVKAVGYQPGAKGGKDPYCFYDGE